MQGSITWDRCRECVLVMCNNNKKLARGRWQITYFTFDEWARDTRSKCYTLELQGGCVASRRRRRKENDALMLLLLRVKEASHTHRKQIYFSCPREVRWNDTSNALSAPLLTQTNFLSFALIKNVEFYKQINFAIEKIHRYIYMLRYLSELHKNILIWILRSHCAREVFFVPFAVRLVLCGTMLNVFDRILWCKINFCCPPIECKYPRNGM